MAPISAHPYLSLILINRLDFGSKKKPFNGIWKVTVSEEIALKRVVLKGPFGRVLGVEQWRQALLN